MGNRFAAPGFVFSVQQSKEATTWLGKHAGKATGRFSFPGET
jgi:hypothetical protein